MGLGCLQDKLIFPGAASQGQKTSIVSPSPKFELIELKTATGEKTFAVFATAQDQFRNALPDAATRPTMIFFYGNGEYLAGVLGDVTYFRQMGVNILAVEYLGYGMAEGRPGEKQFYASADAAYAHLIARPDVDRNQLIAVGRSIGCAPAIDLASRHRFIGVICFSPFTSLTAMGRHVMPFLPTSLILRHKFDNLSKIKTIEAPIFISHGKMDRIVPFFMSEQLRAAAKGEVTFVPIDDGDHNDLMDAGGEDLDTALRKFIERCATSEHHVARPSTSSITETSDDTRLLVRDAVVQDLDDPKTASGVTTVATDEQARNLYQQEIERVTGRKVSITDCSPQLEGTWLVSGLLLVGDGSRTYGDVPAIVTPEGVVRLHGTRDTRDMPTIPQR